MQIKVVALALSCALIGAVTAQQRSIRPDLVEAAKQVIASTNAFRQTDKLAPVEPDAELLKSARYFADFMARTDKYGHAADGHQPAQRAQKFGYEYCIVAENIAYQFSSRGFSTSQLAQRLFEGWQNSPGHRKNMLDPNVTETAVAIAQSENTGRYYAVQLFGRPKSQTIRFSVANRAGVPIEYSLDQRTFPLPPRATRTHQSCRSSTLNWRGTTVEPRDGQNLVITQDDGTLQLKTN
ncbi:MAG: CAP domain-containing protein [Burkholderiaceae bacterium]